MKIAILPNMTRENAFSVTNEICETLRALGAECLLEDTLTDVFSASGAVFLPEAQMLAACDLVIAVGGDGSIIYATHKAIAAEKPVLGINAGRLAFLAGLERHELPLLRQLFTGEYCTEKRMLLRAEVLQGDTCLYSALCVNDAVLSRMGAAKLTGICVEANGAVVGEYLGDGVILATPTGSTAYSLSAGGPVVMSDSRSFVITPMNPHALGIRPQVVSDSVRISVSSIARDQPSNSQPSNSRPTSLGIYADGEAVAMLAPGESVEIVKSEQVSNLVELEGYDPYAVLAHKLGWTGTSL